LVRADAWTQVFHSFGTTLNIVRLSPLFCKNSGDWYLPSSCIDYRYIISRQANNEQDDMDDDDSVPPLMDRDDSSQSDDDGEMPPLLPRTTRYNDSSDNSDDDDNDEMAARQEILCRQQQQKRLQQQNAKINAKIYREDGRTREDEVSSAFVKHFVHVRKSQFVDC
jgi:hypothetical protein